MKDTNIKALNSAAPRLRAIIDTVRKASDECCEDGEFDLSADLRQLEAKLTEAYAIGRRLKDGDGVVIVPMGGGK